jgi:hypothetical protein
MQRPFGATACRSRTFHLEQPFAASSFVPAVVLFFVDRLEHRQR